MKNINIVYIVLLVIIFSCQEAVYNPKPRTYPKVELEDPKYNLYISPDCPYQFNMSDQAIIEKDSSFFDTLAGPCWFNIIYPKLNAKLYCTYYEMTGKETLTKRINETYKLVKGHMVKADYIDEFPFHKPNHVSGMIYEIEGPSATPFQFYLTDSSHNFFRASLYFVSHINPDSLAPYYEFTKKDMMELINSFSWK